MNLNNQIQEIKKYIKNGEKDPREYKIGIEFEHFVMYKDTLKTVSYYGENGIGGTLEELEKKGWRGVYEGEYILELHKEDMTITLEPGSQLEFSIKAKAKIGDIEEGYLLFLQEIIPILEEKNQALIAISYHPETKIDEIKLLPKARYDLMFNYFKTRGSHAHNMMKGTASLQVTIDFENEEDYRKKFRVANAIGPVLYGIFDNGYYFEGDKWGKYNIRTLIWNNCDDYRSGVVEGALEDDFGYEKYAEYVLNRPPIFTIRDGETIPTKDKKVKDILNPEDYDIKELEHLLTMFFPDVRTKNYIEIRMMDSIPYPLNFAAVTLIKGIFYNQENLDRVYDYIKDIGIEDIIRSKKDIIENGLNGRLRDKTVLEIGKCLVELAKNGLEDEEVKYILPLEEMLEDGKNPYAMIAEKVGLGKKESISHCILNNLEVIKK